MNGYGGQGQGNRAEDDHGNQVRPRIPARLQIVSGSAGLTFPQR
jgi:hypothetical protein